MTGQIGAATGAPGMIAAGERFGLPMLAGAIAAFTLARILFLIVSPLWLHGDEAQYWSWAQSLEWGYFSKPPLVAWVIAGTTALFGDDPWAVRLGAPIAHGFGALALALLARDLAGRLGAWFAAASYLTLPAVFLSSAIVSTDAFLLPLWSLGLLALFRLRDGGDLRWAGILGLAIGLGFLAKYAMIYFVIGLGIAVAIDARIRGALLGWSGVLAGLVAALFLGPNLAWNAANDFATLSHTAANANWRDLTFDIGNLFEFWIDQLGVFGPLSWVILVGVLLGFRNNPKGRRDILLVLLGFCVPAFVVVSAQAFISRAHGNWAASAYVAANLIVVLGVLWRGWERRLLGNIALHATVAAVFVVLALSPALANAVGLGNGLKRLRGWPETTEAVRAAAVAGGYDQIVIDSRLLYHGLDYAGRADPLPLAMWLKLHPEPVNHAEATRPLAPGAAGPLLLVIEREREIPRLEADFATLEPKGEIVIELGGDRRRRLLLFEATGYAPLPRDQAWFARFGAD